MFNCLDIVDFISATVILLSSFWLLHKSTSSKLLPSGFLTFSWILMVTQTVPRPFALLVFVRLEYLLFFFLFVFFCVCVWRQSVSNRRHGALKRRSRAGVCIAVVHTVDSYGTAVTASAWGTLCHANSKRNLRHRRRRLQLLCRVKPSLPFSTSTTNTQTTSTTTNATIPATAASASWTGRTRWIVSGTFNQDPKLTHDMTSSS